MRPSIVEISGSLLYDTEQNNRPTYGNAGREPGVLLTRAGWLDIAGDGISSGKHGSGLRKLCFERST
jgi:hypothetical protein